MNATWALIVWNRILGGVVLTLAVPLEAGDSSAPPTSPVPPPNAVALPPLPAVQLAVPQPYADELGFVEAKKAEVDRLIALADQAVEPLEQCRHRLGAANVVLSFLVEPACSAKLLGIEPLRQSVITDELRKTLDDADRLLRQVDDTLTKLEEENESPDPKVTEFRQAYETLDVFREAIRIFLLGDAKSDVSATRRAASRLSVLLEDTDDRVATAAAFWQACLRERVSDPKRVRQLLGPVLADAPSGAIRFAFFSRLLSCRLLAASGSYATSVALLTQLEGRSDRWFVNESDEKDAARTIAFVEMRIVTDWYRHFADARTVGLRSPSATPHEASGTTAKRLTAEADEKPSFDGAEDQTVRMWCVQRLKKLAEAHFGGDSPTLLRLSPVVPLIVPTTHEAPNGRS